MFYRVQFVGSTVNSTPRSLWDGGEGGDGGGVSEDPISPKSDDPYGCK